MKKRKGKDCSYNKQWEAKKTWVPCQQGLKESRLWSENDVTQHASTQMEGQAGKMCKHCQCNSSSHLLQKMAKIAAGESSYVYHTVKHGLNYNNRLSCKGQCCLISWFKCCEEDSTGTNKSRDDYNEFSLWRQLNSPTQETCCIELIKNEIQICKRWFVM